MSSARRPAEQACAAEAPPADEAALWRLPAGGGEAVRLAVLPGGVSAAETAAAADEVVLAPPVLPGAGSGGEASPGDDAARRKAREEAGVTAILHESVPVRYWDHDLGPDQLRLFAMGEEEALRDLTPDPGRALDQQSFALAPDGRTVVTGWRRWDTPSELRAELATIDLADGTRRTLLSVPGIDFEGPEVSPDGRWVPCGRT